MESLLSTVSYVLCDASPATRSQQGSGGLEKDSSDISGKHTAQPAVSSLLAEAAAHSGPGLWLRHTQAAEPAAQ